MKIELIKLKFNDTHSYKHKPFTYCCDEIQNDKAIVFTGEDLVCNDTFGLVVRDSDDNIIPQFCNSYTETFNSWGDEYEQTDNYNELSKQREDLLKKCQRTDSKKKEAELIEQVRKLDNQINGFYLLDEWKEDVYV